MEDRANQICDLSTIMRRRSSVRAFLPQKVEKQDVHEILNIARYAASGGNMQPWKAHVLFEETINKLQDDIKQHIAKNGFAENGDYQYYPTNIESPYVERVQQSGLDLFSALAIERRDTARKREQKLKNFNFFGAPVGIIVTMNRNLSQGSWIDIGIFLNALTLAIVDRGLGCCLQASFSSYGDTIRKSLDLNQENLVICGVALGYEDKSHPINAIPKRRLQVDDFTEYYP